MSVPKTKREPLVKSFVPTPELLVEYFKSMVSGDKINVCVITGLDKKFSVYTERSKDREIACRVFHIRGDAEYYREFVSARERIPYEAVRIWECYPSDLVDFLLKLTQKNKEKDPPKSVKALASVINDGRLYSIDVFWTSEQVNMV